MIENLVDLWYILEHWVLVIIVGHENGIDILAADLKDFVIPFPVSLIAKNPLIHLVLNHVEA